MDGGKCGSGAKGDNSVEDLGLTNCRSGDCVSTVGSGSGERVYAPDGTFLGWKLRKDTEAARAQDPKATSKVTPGSEVNNNA